MNHHFSDLDLKTLRAMLARETDELNAKLLDGATWQEVSDQKKKVTQLAIAIHKKAQVLDQGPVRKSVDDPAES